MAAVAAFAFVGCENDNMDNINNNGPAVNGSEVVFTASLDAVARTLPSAGGAVAWKADDTIGVWDGTNYVNATIKEVNGASVKFSAVVDPEAASYVAVTPADAWNGAAGDKVVLNFPTTQSAGKQIVSVAAISDPATPATFKNTTNLLRFTVKKEAVKYAKLEGRNSETFGATVEVDPATGVGTAATGSATEIVIPITTGENFVALPQGVNLSQGYTITLYGDEALLDYQGEVYSSGAIALDRNKQRNLGVIDGWIDNWKLWEAGKSITIAGVEYSKSVLNAGTLLTAEGEDYDLFGKLYNKTGNLVFFLEEKGSNTFYSSTFINLKGNALLISRYDNQPVTFKFNKSVQCMPNGNACFKGVNIVMTDAWIADTNAGNGAALFRSYADGPFANLHFDNCSFTVPSNFPETKKYIIQACKGDSGNAVNYRGIKSIKVVNSKINIANSTYLRFIDANNSAYFDEFEEVVFENNTIWRSSGDVQQLYLFYCNPGTAQNGGAQKTKVKFTNNTLYNTPPYLFYMSGMSELVAQNNIYCGTTNAGKSRIIAYAKEGDVATFSCTIGNCVADNIMSNVSYINPNSGAYKSLNKVVTNAGATANILKTIDVEKGIFEPTEAYKDKGAQKLF